MNKIRCLNEICISLQTMHVFCQVTGFFISDCPHSLYTINVLPVIWTLGIRQTRTVNQLIFDSNLFCEKEKFGKINHKENINKDILYIGEHTGLVVRASDSGSRDPSSILGRVGVLFP